MIEMMGCGHSANATDGNGNPVCVICIGIKPEAKIVVEHPDLKDRLARCSYYGGRATGRSREGACNSTFGTQNEPCKCEVPSSIQLAFFSHNPDESFDKYYCGCWGWD